MTTDEELRSLEKMCALQAETYPSKTFDRLALEWIPKLISDIDKLRLAETMLVKLNLMTMKREDRFVEVLEGLARRDVGDKLYLLENQVRYFATIARSALNDILGMK